jgi:hypothetical protein
MAKKNDGSTLLIVAVITLVVTAVAFLLILGLDKDIRLAPEGTATVEIESNLAIEVTVFTIDWGTSFVTPGAPATLETFGATIVGWQDGSAPLTPDRGFVIENTGNENIKLDMQLQDPLDTWLTPGPSTTSATLGVRVNNCFDVEVTGVVGMATGNCANPGEQVIVDDDGSTSCTIYNAVPGFTENTLTPIDETLLQVCDTMLFADDSDELRVDLELVLPEDIASSGGAPDVNQLILSISPAIP